MKTAISIPDPVFDAAERLSKRLGVSRSRLYTMALEKALESDPRRGVKEKLDAIYAVQDSRLDAGLAAMQSVSLQSGNDEW